jgi:hypothetical protein
LRLPPGSHGLERLVGARLVVGMQGTTPTPALLEASVAAASAA